MEYLLYILRFLYRIRWWVILGTLVVTLAAFYVTRNINKTYTVETTLYTGVISGYTIESEVGATNLELTSNSMDNLINIIQSESTLKRVSYRLYARNMIHGDLEKDNEYITAASFREIYNRTVNRRDGRALLALIDKTSEEKTLENLLKYERPDKNNFVYGLFYWNHPHYSYGALKKIKITRKGSSDLLDISYSSNDPGVAYNTLDILMKEFVNEYRDIRYGETDKVIDYFRSELARIGHDLRMAEDSLTQYNIEKRVINYTDETKEIAAINKEFELREQDILFAYNSSKVMKQELERQMDSNTKQLLNNISFINKLKEASTLTSRISELESFTTGNPINNKSIEDYQNKLNQTAKELSSISDRYVTGKQTKEGIGKSDIVDQWLTQTLAFEKAKSELDIIKRSRKDLNDKYVFFAPVGSTIKRKERSIDFTEANYLSLLKSYNDALMRKKNLEMTSATLKVLNPPTFPIQPEPDNRRNIVLLAFLGTIAFIIGFFLIIELLDRTLRDKIRTERLTKSELLGAFPGTLRLKYRSYQTVYSLIATKYLSSAILRYFTIHKEGQPYIVNFLSNDAGEGKTHLASLLEAYWKNIGLEVRRITWGENFDINSSEYLLAESIMNLYIRKKEDVLIVEYPNLESNNVPTKLLQEANLNLLILSADRAWRNTDKILFERIKSQMGNVPLCTYLNHANSDVVENYTGMLPPYSYLRRQRYRLLQLGLTAKSSAIKNKQY
ncbi:Wzz/FepE/Etk N-terminal domain-containing protein [uncultured Bacteroides sp.]|uniref:GumC family protein n=1 Tax=uncultured Bacteroides sp. TaxID=162156 RepID=UPI002AA77159|nr:Wzz/FepE/Etk N-terminal domain-containing protein [uncultured Bacteroides sp.]